MSRAAWAAMGQESSLADLFGGAGVQNHAGETVSVLTGLKDKTVLLFFGGKWAEPCEAFRQLLTHIYDVIRKEDSSIAVIFVSNDKSREEQQAFYASMHAEWLCVEWSPGLQDLGDKFGVEHIPGLVVVGRDGSPAIRDARQALLDLMGKEEVSKDTNE